MVGKALDRVTRKFGERQREMSEKKMAHLAHDRTVALNELI